VSIPTIAGYLGVSSDQGTWIITSFAVANGVSVPLTGWLMRRFGIVRTFVTSVVLFTGASFLCGISGNMTELICFRVLQGGVSGPIIPGSQALLLTLLPENRKGTALAIWSMTTLVAPICGPILGGYISDNYAWGWIFLINIPVGIFSAFVYWRSLRTRESATHKLKIDGVGLALLVVWVGSLQVMLDQGKDLDWFNSKVIVGLCIVTVVTLAAWIIWELSEKQPIVASLSSSGRTSRSAPSRCVWRMVFFSATSC
jgi:DHA2 family multidrug resistance protein